MSSLGSRQHSCKIGSFWLLTPMSALQDLGDFSAPFWLHFFISDTLEIKKYPCVTKHAPSPVSCTQCLSQNIQSLWTLHCQFPAIAFCYTLLSGNPEQSPNGSKSLPVDQQFSSLPSLSLMCSSDLINEVVAFSVHGCCSWTGYLQHLMAPVFLLVLCKGTRVSLITSCGFWDTVN